MGGVRFTLVNASKAILMAWQAKENNSAWLVDEPSHERHADERVRLPRLISDFRSKLAITFPISCEKLHIYVKLAQ